MTLVNEMRRSREPVGGASKCRSALLGALTGLSSAVLCVSPQAYAQQPLVAFLDSARTRNFDVRDAEAQREQLAGVAAQTRARLLPSFTATGSYTRNEHETSFAGGVTITPHDQLEARFTLAVPVLDTQTWLSLTASDAQAAAAEVRVEGAELEAAVAVTQLWYQLVAARAFADSAARVLDAAEHAKSAAEARVRAGAAPALELARAEAEVARAEQSVAEAAYQTEIVGRNLALASGLHPSAERVELSVEAGQELAWAQIAARVLDLPSVRAAERDLVASQRARTGAWLSYLPVVVASATQRITNAAGFGEPRAWTAGATATWNLDFVRAASIRTQGAAADLAESRYQRTRQVAENLLFEGWQRVRSLVARANAARRAEEASDRAARDAALRFENGAGTQLDQIQAERDRFSAEVTRISAVADLGAARAILGLRMADGDAY